MKAVCQEFAQLKPNPAGVFITAAGQVVPTQLQSLASEFVVLQAARHQADYDTGVTVTQAEADIDVKRAESAFQYWNTVQADPAAATFLAELLCRGIPKR
jgi:hypothetical protein